MIENCSKVRGFERDRDMFLGGVTHDLLDGGPVPILFGH